MQLKTLRPAGGGKACIRLVSATEAGSASTIDTNWVWAVDARRLAGGKEGVGSVRSIGAGGEDGLADDEVLAQQRTDENAPRVKMVVPEQ